MRTTGRTIAASRNCTPTLQRCASTGTLIESLHPTTKAVNSSTNAASRTAGKSKNTTPSFLRPRNASTRWAAKRSTVPTSITRMISGLRCPAGFTFFPSRVRTHLQQTFTSHRTVELRVKWPTSRHHFRDSAPKSAATQVGWTATRLPTPYSRTWTLSRGIQRILIIKDMTAFQTQVTQVIVPTIAAGQKNKKSEVLTFLTLFSRRSTERIGSPSRLITKVLFQYSRPCSWARETTLFRLHIRNQRRLERSRAKASWCYPQNRTSHKRLKLATIHRSWILPDNSLMSPNGSLPSSSMKTETSTLLTCKTSTKRRTSLTTTWRNKSRTSHLTLWSAAARFSTRTIRTRTNRCVRVSCARTSWRLSRNSFYQNNLSSAVSRFFINH